MVQPTKQIGTKPNKLELNQTEIFKNLRITLRSPRCEHTLFCLVTDGQASEKSVELKKSYGIWDVMLWEFGCQFTLLFLA